jgi:hypothetical protein
VTVSSKPEAELEQPACEGLGRILAPLTVEQFLDRTFGKGPLHLKGEQGRFHDLLDWDDLARLIESRALEPPRFAIMRAGQPIAPERYLTRPGGIARIDGGALSMLLDSGATMIINHVDDLVGGIAVLADKIGDRLGARIAVNLYATWRSEHGFDPHWDYHDVIVLQLAGRKEWPIFEPTMTDPLRGDSFEAPPTTAAPHHVATLEDGDVLYVPRGWIHAPAPLGEPSLHLTVAITRPTGAGFLEWLANDLRKEPEVRASLPLAGDQAGLAAWKLHLGTRIRDAIDKGAVERFQAFKDAERGARPILSFPGLDRIPVDQWNESTMLRPSSLHRLPAEMADDESGGQVTVMGRSWPCSSAVARALQRLKSTRAVTLGELESELSPADSAQLRQLIGLFATMGLLSARQS